MSDDNQIEIAQSFVALHVRPGRSRPDAPWETVLARYEQCEDMALTLVEHAQALAFRENIAELEILRRCHAGLVVDGSAFSATEAAWVVCRLAELLEWDLPDPMPSGG
jgi:hypothetical protein